MIAGVGDFAIIKSFGPPRGWWTACNPAITGIGAGHAGRAKKRDRPAPLIPPPQQT
jgi:hypothetical protein